MSAALTAIGNSAPSITISVGVSTCIVVIGHGRILITCCLVIHGNIPNHPICGQNSILSAVLPAFFSFKSMSKLYVFPYGL